MPTIDETVAAIVAAPTWEARIAALRQVPANHGTNDYQAVYAQVARRLYVPHLSPDFAYVHLTSGYELERFQAPYARLAELTDRFSAVDVGTLTSAIARDPTVLLPLRLITGLTATEFAACTRVVAEDLGGEALSASKVTSMERAGSRTSHGEARVAATTADRLVRRVLFDEPAADLQLKQDKPDTADGWESVRRFAVEGVPYVVLLHQRHYGGAFRQVLDATSTLRGNSIETAVEDLFGRSGVPYVRTGAHNQGEIEERFGVQVHPAPDFVTFDQAGTLRAMLECKGANDGGTARDKALRFRTLAEESQRLGGVPLVAVLGGLGWTRVNDTLGPVVRYCDGRVFSVGNLEEMLTVAPFPQLVDLVDAAPGQAERPAAGRRGPTLPGHRPPGTDQPLPGFDA